MKLGLIARMDNSGLGIQTWEAYRHLKPHKTMVIDFHAYKDMLQYPERYSEGDVTFVTSVPAPKDIDTFLNDIDILFTCETPYTYVMIDAARSRGIKVLIQPNYEFAGWIKNKALPLPDAFGVPSKWHYDQFPEPKIYLPVPIATDRFKPNTSESARQFLHMVGMPAANDRNGTIDLIEALEFVKSNIVMTFTCQRRGYVEELIRGRTLPRNVRIVVKNDNVANYWQVYDGFDVLVMPRRYGGLCLPVNEALGAGMPVIMPDCSPNNLWLPKEWLVSGVVSFKFQPGRLGNEIEVFKTQSRALAAKIDQFASDPGTYAAEVAKANKLAADNSWDALKKLYLQTFDTIIKA